MTSFIALGRLRAFEERVVLPHEKTFPKVIGVCLTLLKTTPTNLESIFLLDNDPKGQNDALLGHLDA